MNAFNLVWIILLLWFLILQIRPRLVRQQRDYLIRQLEKKRGTKVISLVYPSQNPSLFNFIYSRYIDLSDAQKIIKTIRHIPPDKPIDLILHTTGGLVLATRQIVQALLNHPSAVNVFVPYYALSGGTLLAIAGSSIHLDKNAYLGRIDPQIFNLPAVSVLAVPKVKKNKNIDDKTLVLADISQKSLIQVRHFLSSTLKKRGYPSSTIKVIVKELMGDKYTHDHPLTLAEAKSIGLNIDGQIPPEVYRFTDLFQSSRPDDGIS